MEVIHYNHMVAMEVLDINVPRTAFCEGVYHNTQHNNKYEPDEAKCNDTRYAYVY